MAQNQKQKATTRLKNRSKLGLSPQDVKPFFAELTTGSDRAAALVATSYLDAEMADTLEAVLHFETKEEVNNLLRNPNAPLSTFSARIKMLKALRIVDSDVFGVLETLRAIRNEFAHSFVPMAFETPEVTELCSNLPLSKNKWPEGTVMSETRTRFLNSCMTVAFILSRTAKAHKDEAGKSEQSDPLAQRKA